MRFKPTSTLLAIIILLGSAFFCCSCLQARPPEKTEGKTAQEQPVEKEKAAAREDTPVDYSLPIDAGVSGKEYVFRSKLFTHLAVKSDDSMTDGVKVWMSLNGDYVGTFYADGWEDKSKDHLLINPGDISEWIPKRGTWIEGDNTMKLRFLMPGVGGLDVPMASFLGTLFFKNDPAAYATGTQPKTKPGESEQKDEGE